MPSTHPRQQGLQGTGARIKEAHRGAGEPAHGGKLALEGLRERRLSRAKRAGPPVDREEHGKPGATKCRGRAQASSA